MKLDVQKAVAHRLVMLSGEESALRRSALALLLAEAEVPADDFDLQSYDADTPALDWLASAGTAPFLAKRRTVVVRHLLRSDPEMAASPSWSSLPEYAFLVLVVDDEQGDDERQRKHRSIRTAWEKLVSVSGGLVVKCDASPGDLRDLVRASAAEAGKRISDRAVETLSEFTGASASRAVEEVPKLIAFVGDEGTIQESDVKAVVVPSREWNVFKLVDASVAGDAAEALRQLRILVGSATKAEGVAFSAILPQLSRSLRLVWQARVCLDARERLDSISDHTRAAMLRKPNLANEKEYIQGKAVRAAKRCDLEQIGRMLAIVADVDAKLKGLLPSLSAIETLEQAVLKMASAGSPRATMR